MRRTFYSVMLIVLLLIVAVSLAACQEEEEKTGYEPESAIALWEKIDQTMDTVKSAQTKMSVDVLFYSMGYEFHMEEKGCILFTQDTYYTDSNMTVSCDELSIEQSISTVEAYYDGKMYTATNDGTYDQRFCSPMTMDEFKQVQSGGLSTDEIDFADCTSMVFEKGEGDTWNLQFSGYTKKTIDKVLEEMMLFDGELGSAIADMETKVTADGSFRVQKMEITFLFEEDESQPRFSLITETSGFNTTTFDPEKLDPASYKDVADVRILNYISEALKEKQDASSGEFTLDMKTTYDMQGQTTVYTEKDIVSYGRKNGAYCYFITAEMDEESLTMQYQNGQQTVETGGQSQNAEQPEEEAKAFIDSLIDSARYSGVSVTDIQKQEVGVFTLTVDQADLSTYVASVIGTGIELVSGTQEMTVTFYDRKLSGIDSKLTMNGIYNGDTVMITIESALVFKNTDV